VTPSEREAFDALVKYAEMEEDSRALSSKDLDAKYKCEPSDFTHRMRANRRLALEKAREVQAAPNLFASVKSVLFNDPVERDYGTGYRFMVTTTDREWDTKVAKAREEVREGGE